MWGRSSIIRQVSTNAKYFVITIAKPLRGDFHHRLLGEAEHIWDLALRPALEWEQESRVSGLRIHKGTPYYFWGMTALLRGDLDRGYCLIHQAVSEDSATNPETYRTLPGFALATLDYEKPDQAFRQWVLQQADFLAKRVVRYSDIHGRPFALRDFQDRFLRQPPDTDTLFLFAHVVARLMQLSEIPGYLTQNGFAGQLEVNLLFDLTLVTDVAAKAQNGGKWKFIEHAETLLARAGHPLSKSQLTEIHDGFKDDFEATLRALVERSYQLPSGSTVDTLQRDVALAYGLRNRAAHTVSAPAIWRYFAEVQQAVFNTLFAVVDHLYR